MSIKYAVGRQKVERAGSLEMGTHPVIVWVADEYFGLHPTSIAAKRAYVEAMWPDTKGRPDDYIKRFFDRQARSSMPQAKIVKVPKVERNGAEKLYHGSDDDSLEELDGNEPGYRGSLGWGLYLTTDLEFAKIFGKHIYEVESPVPDELVAYIEPMTHYECGHSMEMYTPGSTPFTFEIEDRKTGKTHRYSVLGDCDEQVHEELRRSVLEEFTPSQELKDDVNKLPAAIASRVGVGAKEILDAAIDGERIDHVIEAFLSTMVEEKEEKEGEADADFLSLLDNEVQPLLEALEREIDEFARTQVAERLGLEIDLDDISKLVEYHGYSAFFIEGYAPGNEYVIVDEKYLPIPVTLT